jgi:hypothetical protein
MERWIQIKEHPDYYVSDLGRIKSTKCNKERILKPWKMGNYLGVWLDTNYRYYIHHLVAEAFLGVKDNDTIDHINRDTKDNRAINLRYATFQENSVNTTVQRNNTLGHKNICIKNYGYNDYYNVKITRFGKLVFFKSCKTLEEAITARNNFINSE